MAVGDRGSDVLDKAWSVMSKDLNRQKRRRTNYETTNGRETIQSECVGERADEIDCCERRPELSRVGNGVAVQMSGANEWTVSVVVLVSEKGIEGMKMEQVFIWLFVHCLRELNASAIS